MDSRQSAGSTLPGWDPVDFRALICAVSAGRALHVGKRCADMIAFTLEKSRITVLSVESISEKLFISASIKLSTRVRKTTNAASVERSSVTPRVSAGIASFIRKVRWKRCPPHLRRRPSIALTPTLNVAWPKIEAKTRYPAPHPITPTLKMSSRKTAILSLSPHLNSTRSHRPAFTPALYAGSRSAIIST